MKTLTFNILLVLIFFSVMGYSQNEQAKLEEKRKRLIEEIEYTNKLLKETKSSTTNTLNELNLLNLKVNKRTDLIATLKSEIFHLNTKIDNTEIQLMQLEENLENLKTKYAEIAWHAFKYKTAYNKLMFLFSADGINQAYQRMRYLDQLSSYIRTEAERITEIEKRKSLLLTQLKSEKAEKTNLLGKEQTEIFELENEKAQKSRIKRNLESRERQLRKAIRDKEKETRSLDKQIQKIILAEAEPKVDNSGNKTYGLTPDEKRLSSSFATNKGKLPWPTERGVLSGTFGVHNHPVLKKVKVKNNGIDIATSKNSKARAVFDGKVVSITKISNTNIAVIIKHGDYFTVYSNLEQVFVKKGDAVKIKDPIGVIHTNLKGETELHFEIWKGSKIQNPSYWVAKK